MGERLLVVAPHPDDESFGAGGVMARARQRGDEVFVVLMTLGDGFVEDAARYYLSLDVNPEEYRHMGYERRIETLTAMRELGVAEDRVFFLGFPDGGLDALWRTHWDAVWTSTTTGFQTVSYLDAFSPGVPYQGRHLLELLVGIFREVRPDRLIMPSAFDTHPDHWATNAFATLAWANLAQQDPGWRTVSRWGYLVHWPAWPFPLVYQPDKPFKSPPSLVNLHQEPWRVESIAPESVEQKRRALLAHESQAELIKPFMLTFCRATEMFSEEDRWSPLVKDEGSWLVQNPRPNWRQRLLGRQNPLASAVWHLGFPQDAVRIAMPDGFRHDYRLEVTIHSVGGSHYRWITGETLPEMVSVEPQRQAVTMRWPGEWLGEVVTVMAGVQIYVRDKCEGKVPFRVMSRSHG